MKHETQNGDRATAAIPARLQRRAGRLLAAGATFEETRDELLRRGAEQLSLKAVQDFFRSNPKVQRERIERRRQAVEELKQALAGPDCLHRSLAEAALFVGLTELTAPRDLYRSQLNNCRLQIHTQRLKCRRATLGERVAHTQLKLATVRWEMAQLTLAELERELAQQFRQYELPLPALSSLRKIHALIGNPSAARRLGGSNHRPRAAENSSSGGNENHDTTQTGNSQ
jgi:hypothetical protein